MADTLPSTDSGLLAWSLNASTRISAAPATYGVPAAISASFVAAHANFATAMTACDPGERNKSAVAAKNLSRKLLKIQARFVIKLVEGTPTVSDAQKLELGIVVPAPPSPIPVPAYAPAVETVSVTGRTVKARLRDATNASRRGKPAGVLGASIFSFVGATAPTDLAAWKFEGNTGKTLINVVFPETLAPGSKVWITAYWFNPRKQAGPLAAPVAAYTQFGTVSQAA